MEHLDSRARKASGAHYTPVELARFLAEVSLSAATPKNRVVKVLDPACGDGSLLRAVADMADPSLRSRLLLTGFETDSVALEQASENLQDLAIQGVRLEHQDFLLSEETESLRLGPIFEQSTASTNEKYDIVISNPPYVRTQVLGAKRSQLLAKQFGLSGRVDLYHAFVKAIHHVLQEDGVLGLLTSNRFMVIRSGATTRELLRRSFQIEAVYDLGDTKLFEAAVLPAIVVAKKSSPTKRHKSCPFSRVYEARSSDQEAESEYPSVIAALRTKANGVVRTPAGVFCFDRGELGPTKDAKSTWTLISRSRRKWLSTVASNQQATFGEVASIRVGIKTTADKVFIRDDWQELPTDKQPEPELLWPLITHHVAARWKIGRVHDLPKRVLYTHKSNGPGKRTPIDLEEYPRARAYLESHRERLLSRKYVIEAGRQWFEIWVPQDPLAWSLPKIVFPDISEHPRFFVEPSGKAIVNGDCYWITLKTNREPQWFPLMLAVANSSFGAHYYDVVFHNKLYSGRRRFMTQYVNQFPLPNPTSPSSQEIIRTVSRLTEDIEDDNPGVLDEALDDLVWQSFGVTKEVTR